MGGIGYALGSIISGAGEGLAAQAEDNSKTADAELASRRMIALENLRGQNEQAAIASRATVDDTLDAHKQARAFSYDTETNSQKANADLQKEVTLKGIDLSNDQTLEAFKTRNRLTEIQAQSAADIQKEAAAEHTKIGRIVFSKNGQAIIYKEDGSAYVRGQPGDFVPSGESESVDPFNDGTVAGAISAGGDNSPAATAPAARAATAPPANVDKSILGQLAHMPPPPDGKVGRTMSGPNGMTATWNGKTWVLDDVNGGQ